MIHQTISKWHDYMRGKLANGLDELLDDDVIFYSPVLFAPQVGKDLTSLYLTAAAQVFPGDQAATSLDKSSSKGSFRYVKEIIQHPTAVLEFETTIDGKSVNGIDMITVNDEGKIIEFKVMVRPLSAINVIKERMMVMLETLRKD